MTLPVQPGEANRWRAPQVVARFLPTATGNSNTDGGRQPPAAATYPF